MSWGPDEIQARLFKKSAHKSMDRIYLWVPLVVLLTGAFKVGYESDARNVLQTLEVLVDSAKKVQSKMTGSV